jgi:hypothetical protein
MAQSRLMASCSAVSHHVVSQLGGADRQLRWRRRSRSRACAGPLMRLARALVTITNTHLATERQQAPRGDGIDISQTRKWDQEEEMSRFSKLGMMAASRPRRLLTSGFVASGSQRTCCQKLDRAFSSGPYGSSLCWRHFADQRCCCEVTFRVAHARAISDRLRQHLRVALQSVQHGALEDAQPLEEPSTMDARPGQLAAACNGNLDLIACCKGVERRLARASPQAY